MKLLAKTIILITVFSLGLYFGATLQPEVIPKKYVSVSDQSVSLMIDYGNGTVNAYNNLDIEVGKSVFGLLKTVAQDNNISLDYKDYGELGVFIEGINGIKNDAGGDKWWQYWINNDYAKIGASLYQLKAGDIIEWKFIKGQLN